MARSDHELIRQVQAGSLEAFDVLFTRYSDEVFSFCWRYMRNHMDAEEALQETFTKLWKYRSSYKPTGNFKSYLLRIARNVCTELISDANKTRNLEEVMTEPEEVLTDEQRGPEEHSEIKELEAIVRDAIHALPDKLRDVFILNRYHYWSYRRIAETFNLPVRTVESRLYLAYQRLSAVLAPYRDKVSDD